MKKINIKHLGIVLLTIMMIPATLFAHGGRTDSSGGHKDNKNKSGLGSYHYHCGGYPAHLHSNGVCPYSSSSSNTSSNSSSSKNSTSTTKSTPTYTEKEETFIIAGETVKINTINIDSTNLVELKTLCEKLGISTTYDSSVKSIDCVKGSTSFTLQIDSKNLWLNGTLSTLNVAPVAHNGRTMIPARVVAEAIGKTVTYDSSNNQIIIE